MKKIQQSEQNSCVPATIAMLLGLSESKVKRLFPHKRQWKTYGTNINQIHYVLKLLGYRIVKKNRLGHRHCLLILQDDGLRWIGKHASAWDGNKIIDPGQHPKLSQRQLRRLVIERWELFPLI